MKLSASGVSALIAVAGVGVVIALIYKNRAKIAAAFNPASTENLAYKGVTDIMQAITGNKIDTAGTAVANVFPSAAERAVNAMLAPAAPTLTRVVSPIGPEPYETISPTTSPGSEALTTVQPYMFGLGETGAARVRNFRPGRRIR